MRISGVFKKLLHDNKSPGGQSVGEHIFQAKSNPQNYTKVFYQDEFLISTTFWNKLFFYFLWEKKKENENFQPQVPREATKI